jgi:hypothetical protein
MELFEYPTLRSRVTHGSISMSISISMKGMDLSIMTDTRSLIIPPSCCARKAASHELSECVVTVSEAACISSYVTLCAC